MNAAGILGGVNGAGVGIFCTGVAGTEAIGCWGKAGGINCAGKAAGGTGCGGVENAVGIFVAVGGVFT